MLHRRTSLVSGLRGQNRAAVHSVVTSSSPTTTIRKDGSRMPRPAAFSLSERTSTSTLSEVKPSPQHGHYRLPKHVREYVRQLRAKRDMFDKQRNQLERGAQTNVSGTDILKRQAPEQHLKPAEHDDIASLVVPWRDTHGHIESTSMPVSLNATSVTGGEGAKVGMSAYNVRNFNHGSPSNISADTIQAMMEEKDAHIESLQIKLHNCLSERSAEKQKVQEYVVEREAAIRDLTSQLAMSKRQTREVREIAMQNEATMDGQILALQQRVRILEEALDDKKHGREIGTYMTFSGRTQTERMAISGLRQYSVETSVLPESTQLVKELRSAIESLEKRNLELSAALSAAQNGILH